MIKLTKFKLIDISSIETITGNKKVYDISVKDDESYTANNLIVHNCTTAANVAINYPLGSLISECYELKKQYNLKTKIVADGGMKNYSDIIKSLALGADYVMIGSIFNKSIESAGFNYLYGIKIKYKLAKILWKYNFPIKKKYRGMSTKAVQRSWGKTKLVTAEGITKYQKVEYTLGQWRSEER